MKKRWILAGIAAIAIAITACTNKKEVVKEMSESTQVLDLQTQINTTIIKTTIAKYILPKLFFTSSLI